MEPRFKKTRYVGIIPEGTGENQSVEAFKWRNHKQLKVFNSSAPPVSLAYSPGSSSDLYLASGICVSLRSETKDKYDAPRSILKLNDSVPKIALRSDGLLLAVGSNSGEIYIVDVSTKAVLRTLRGHSAPVKALAFLSDKKHLISASDDKTVRTWDITDGSEVWASHANSDFNRACCVCETLGKDLFVTGSYDHTVHLWSLTNGPQPIATFDHGSPVEAVVISDSSDLIASAGLSAIKLWTKAGVLLKEITLHHRTITKLGMTSDGKYVFSSSLDRSFKIVDIQNFKLLHQFKFSAPILDFSLSKRQDRLAVGLNDGQVMILKFAGDDAVDAQKPKITRAALPESQQLRRIDRCFKEFNYREALDVSLRHPSIALFVSCIRELLRRDALQVAFSGRTEVELVAVLKIIDRHFISPRYASILFQLLDFVVMNFGHEISSSRALESSFRRLHGRVKTELLVQDLLSKLKGGLRLISLCS